LDLPEVIVKRAFGIFLLLLGLRYLIAAKS
jgi:hypothetical protein